MFRTCPRKYKFRYIEKVSVPERVSADLYLGSAVHRQLRKAYELGADGILYPLEDMIAAYRAEWDKPGMEKIAVTGDYRTVVDYIRSGEEMLRRFYDQYQPYDQGTLLGVERNFRFCLPGTPFRFVAIIDRLWRREDEVIEICDYKTGRHLASPGDRFFLEQMGLYQLAIQSVYPQFQQVDLAQYFLRHGEVVCRRVSQYELDELAEQLRQTVLQTIHAQRLDDFPTRENGHCSYCEYYQLCPAKRHRLHLEAEAGTDGPEKTTLESAAALADRYAAADAEYKRLKAEREALRQDVVRTARELDVSNLAGSRAEVSVRISREEQFVTKTSDAQAFAQLARLAREWQLDECFSLDGKALMSERYRTERLTSAQLEEMKKFVVEKENARVSVRSQEPPGEDEV